MIALLLACAEPPARPSAVGLAPVGSPDLPDLEVPLTCAPACGREEAARQGARRAVAWLGANTREGLVKYDVPIALAQIRRRFRSAPADAELARLVSLLDDGGDPRRRLWDESARLPAELPRWSEVPGQRPNANLALVEALYCAERGFHPELGPWVCSELRDGGGRMSGHAAWVLAEAVGRGCLPRADTCLDALREELVAGAADPRPREDTLARDELAEQLLFGTLAGAAPDALAPAADRLLALQAADGSFGAPGPGEDPWWNVHATLAGAWALAAWLDAALPDPATGAP